MSTGRQSQKTANSVLTAKDQRRAFAIGLGLVLFAVMLASSAAVLFFFFDWPSVIILNTVFAISAAGLGIVIRRRGQLETAGLAAVVLFMSYLLSFFFVVEQQHYSFYLVSLVPPTTIFVLGSRRSLAPLAAFFAIMAAFVAVRMNSWEPVPFTTEAVFNLATVTTAHIVWTYRVEAKRCEAEAALAKTNAALQSLAVTDVLTGLANRAKLDLALQELVALVETGHESFAILLADLDRFKTINDRFGHGAGDEALQQIAAILRVESRPGDVVGRWGGEEFMLLCPGTDQQQGLALAEAIRRAVQAAENTYVKPLTISIGVAVSQSGDGVESLLKRADSALYEAKADGRNQVVCR